MKTLAISEPGSKIDKQILDLCVSLKQGAARIMASCNLNLSLLLSLLFWTTQTGNEIQFFFRPDELRKSTPFFQFLFQFQFVIMFSSDSAKTA